jgi:Xaa-Pro aminopeptidase
MLRTDSSSIVALCFSAAFATSSFGQNSSGAEQYPSSDPPLPALSEPTQAELPQVYEERRKALMKEMGEGVAAIFAEGQEDGDGYRQSSDFFYLTGVVEPGAVLLLAPRERTYREFLFLPNRDPEAERWTGEREPLGAALRKKYGFEKIYRISYLQRFALEFASRSPIFCQVMNPPENQKSKPADLELYGQISAKLSGISTRPRTFALARMRSRQPL